METEGQLSTLGVCGMASLVSLIGIFLILAAVKDWNWFFDSYKYRHLVRIFGRKAARIMIGCVGGVVALFSIGMAIKVVVENGL
ncbi:MAG: immunity 17 family protein [Planctomycetota bacterium]|jgi:hypothetical protein